jgi:hypothetical protein
MPPDDVIAPDFNSLHFDGAEARFLHVIAVAWLALAGAFSPVHAEKRVALQR